MEDEVIDIKLHPEVLKFAGEAEKALKRIEKKLRATVTLVVDKAGLRKQYESAMAEIAKSNRVPLPASPVTPTAPKNSPPRSPGRSAEERAQEAAAKAQRAKERADAKAAREAEALIRKQERAAANEARLLRKAQEDEERAQEAAAKAQQAKERAVAKAAREAEALIRKQERAVANEARLLRKAQEDEAKSQRERERINARMIRAQENERRAAERNAAQEERARLRLDTTRASADLRAWQQRNRDIQLRVSIHKSGLQKATSALASLGGGAAKIAGTATAIGGIGAMATASAGGLAALAASLVSVVGVAGLAPAVLGAAGAATGTLFAAWSGMGDALKKMNEAAKPENAGPDPRIEAINTAKAHEQAADSIIAAADAYEAAQQRMDDANHRVSESQNDLAKASKGVADAYADVDKQLGKVNQSLRESQLDQEDAADKLKEARDALAQAEGGGSAFSPGEIEAARKAVKRASAEYDKQTDTVKELSDEKKRLSDADNTDEVVSAKEREAAAEHDALIAARERKDAVKALGKAQTENSQAAANAARDLSLYEMQRLAAQNSASKAAEHAMDKLTPSAAVAAVALMKVKDRLGEVRDIAQESFFKGFAGPLEHLADVLIPQLKTGVGGLAGALGDGAQQLMNSLSGNLGGGVLEGMFGKTTEATTIMNGAIEPLTRSLVKMGEVGTKFLPGLATSFVDMSEQFGSFIDRVSADGSMAAWIQGGLDTAKEIGGVLSGAFGILKAIGTAAQDAGGSTLKMLGDSLKQIAATMAAEPFHSALVQIFQGAGGAVSNLMTALKPLGDMFVQMAPTLAQVLPMIGTLLATALTGIATTLSQPGFLDGIMGLFTGLLSGVTALLPAMGPLGEILGTVGKVLGEVARVVGPIIAELFTALAPIVNELLIALMPLIQALGPLLSGAIQTVMPIVTLLMGIITALIPIITGFAKVITGLLTGDFKLIGEGLTGVFDGIKDYFVKLWTELIPGYFKSGIDKATKFGESFIEWFNQLPEHITAPIRDMASWFLDAGKVLITNFIDGIKAMFPDVGGAVGDLMQTVADFFPHSRPKRGPLHDKYVDESARDMWGDFAESSLKQKDVVAKAADSVMGAIRVPRTLSPANAAAMSDRVAAVRSNALRKAQASAVGGFRDSIINVYENASVENTLIGAKRLASRGT